MQRETAQTIAMTQDPTDNTPVQRERAGWGTCLAIPLDCGHFAQQLHVVEGRIVVGNRIATCYEVQRVMNCDDTSDTVSKKAALCPKEAHVPNCELIHCLVSDGYNVTRPNTREHAFSQNSQA